MLKTYKKIIYILTVFLLIFMVDLSTIWTPDDWNLSFVLWTPERIDSLAKLLKSSFLIYQKVSGRVVSFTLYLFLLQMPAILRAIVMASLFTVCLYLISSVFNKDNLCFKMSIVVVMFFITVPAFAENFIWIGGCANYLYPTVIGLLFLKQLTDLVLQRQMDCKKYLMILTAFLCGLSSENVLFLMGAFIFCLFLFRRKEIWTLPPGEKRVFWGCIVAFLGGGLIFLLSPGNWIRLNGGGGISLYWKNVLNAVLSMWIYWVLFILILIIWWKKDKEKYKVLLLNFIFPILLSFIPMLLIPEFPSRAMLPIISYSLAVIMFNLNGNINKLVRNGMEIVSICLAFGLCCAYVTTALPYKVAYEKDIEEQKQAGIRDCIIDKYEKPKYLPERFIVNKLYIVGECKWNTTNVYMAKYYGVDTITALDKGNVLVRINLPGEEGLTNPGIICEDKMGRQLFTADRIIGDWLFEFDRDMRLGIPEYSMPEQLADNFKIVFPEQSGYTFTGIEIQSKNGKSHYSYDELKDGTVLYGMKSEEVENGLLISTEKDNYMKINLSSLTGKK